MYKALYKFEGQGERTLSFQNGDEFNLIDQVNEHWWLMQTLTGETGLVPSSYLAINKTVKSEIVESIDRAIDIIHKTAGKRGGPLTTEERKNLQKLISHRQSVVDDKSVGTDFGEKQSNEQPQKQQQEQGAKSKTTKSNSSQQSQQKQENESVKQGKKIVDENIYTELPEQPKRLAPSPPGDTKQRSQSVKARRRAPAPPALVRSTSEKKSKAPSSNSIISNTSTSSGISSKKANEATIPEISTQPVVCDKDHIASVSVPTTLGVELVSKVRDRINASEEKSQEAVSCVLQGIKDSIPSLSGVMDSIISKLPQPPAVPQGKKSFGPEDELRAILDDLSERKDDSQQRSWALHEDYHIIQSLLTKLTKILAENDKNISMKLLREDDYHYLNDLVVYYQMEPRVGLRILLIQTFGCCCQFGYEFITQLLCTVLPTELARELKETENITNFLNIALLLTMLFSTGENIPLHQYAQLNEEFLDFLFDCIERPHLVDEYNQIPYSLVSVLLSFNQHFKDPSENKVLQVMAERRNLAMFTEKILLLVNREDDPVSIFEYHKPEPSSVVKMLQDIFSRKETSNIFFTNDLMVLIDIILRQLTDRSPGDKVRTQFLSLFYDMITSSNYREHRHRSEEFGECFTSILVDEENDIEDDKYIVRNISSEFNTIFPIFI